MELCTHCHVSSKSKYYRRSRQHVGDSNCSLLNICVAIANDVACAHVLCTHFHLFFCLATHKRCFAAKAKQVNDKMNKMNGATITDSSRRLAHNLYRVDTITSDKWWFLALPRNTGIYCNPIQRPTSHSNSRSPQIHRCQRKNSDRWDFEWDRSRRSRCTSAETWNRSLRKFSCHVHSLRITMEKKSKRKWKAFHRRVESDRRERE